MRTRPSTQRLLLLSIAVFAMLWGIARACLQSITIDEADTYIAFISRAEPFHWSAATNNHVLNSLLMRLCISLFGTYHLTVRLPALIGAALYIWASYLFCRLLGRTLAVRWILLVLLVYNPFVFDYLVAARGYALAMGFLMWGIALPALCLFRRRQPRLDVVAKACAMSSVCLALSFAANFAFALVDGAAVLMIFAWSCWSASVDWPRRMARGARLAVACTIPGLTIFVFLTASIVFAFPKAELTYGAHSLHEMFHSVIEASLYQPNPELLSPLIHAAMLHLRPLLLPLISLFCVARLGVFVFSRSGIRSPAGRRARWLAGLGGTLAGAVFLSLAAHWTAFRVLGVPLPIDRTALFLAPLAVLLVSVVSAVSLPSLAGRVTRSGLVATLFLCGLYFLGCLRLTYFKEWKWDANVNRAYSVLSYYNHRYGVRDVASSWHYVSALNFYRNVSGNESLAEFVSSPGEPQRYPLDRQVYVLMTEFDQPFIDDQRLKVVYRGESTGIVVAIRPELEHGPASCPPELP